MGYYSAHLAYFFSFFSYRLIVDFGFLKGLDY
jgi:hypothetical protein